VPLFNVLAGVLLVLSICAILMLGEEVLVHLALGIVLSFALSPIVSWLRRLGLSRGFAVLGAIVFALALIAGISYVSYWQATILAADIPSYEPTIRHKIAGLSQYFAGRGVFSNAADALARVFADVQALGGEDAANRMMTVRLDDEAHGFAALYEYFEPLLHPLATLFVVLLLAAFMLAQREDLRNRFIRLVGTDDLQQTTAALDDAGRRVGRMLLTQLALNGAFGLTIGIGLWFIGLPSPFLWGIFAGILRFVPYIGPIIGLAPPLFVAFAIDPGWASLVWTIALFAVVEPLVGHVIEPLLYGHSAGLSPVAIVVAATVWAFLWGPIGLVLSTPLTICLVVIGRHVKRLQFLDILLGDRPALAPHEIFYQRMLAGDPGEAEEQAREFLKGRSLATYYDEIALEAIRRAHLDVVRGSVAGDRLDQLVKSAQILVGSLDAVRYPMARGGEANTEAEAAFDLIRPDREADKHIFTRDELAPAWQGKTPVAILFGSHPLDGAAALMLAQVLTKHGLAAQPLPLGEASRVSPVEAGQVVLVCLSFVEPLSTLHLRASSLQVRRIAPQAKVMLCIWQKTDDALIANLRKKLRVENVVTTISDALDVAGRMAVAADQATKVDSQSSRPFEQNAAA
jgi:predicted PurR-regulated permease PerM